MLSNLLSNALKYSAAERRVALRLRQREGCATFAVRDKGQGIPLEAIPRLFERFYRAPGVKVQHGSGVGLGVGLYISRELIEMHGGQIEVHSTIGRGTTVIFTLPLSPSCTD